MKEDLYHVSIIRRLTYHVSVKAISVIAARDAAVKAIEGRMADAMDEEFHVDYDPGPIGTEKE